MGHCKVCIVHSIGWSTIPVLNLDNVALGTIPGVNRAKYLHAAGRDRFKKPEEFSLPQILLDNIRTSKGQRRLTTNSRLASINNWPDRVLRLSLHWSRCIASLMTGLW